MWGNLRRLRNDDDIHLRDTPPIGRNALRSAPEHLDGIAAGVGGIGVGEHLTDIAERRRAEYRIGHGVCDGIAVGMTVEMDVTRNAHATKSQRTTRREAVRIVADAAPKWQTAIRDHAAATAIGAMME
jgi:hypothetical protein